MSNFLAVATVTATLRRVLQEAVALKVSGAQVTNLHPDTTPGDTKSFGVNIYLYHVTHNAAWRNADLPTRRSHGQLGQRPQVALDLHYLITFHGDENKLVPQRLLGAVTSALHAQPLLLRPTIGAVREDSTFEFLRDSDLEHQSELVKLVPLSYTTEEFSRLASTLFRNRYALWTAYRATVVLIDGDAVPVPALPTRAVRLDAAPLGQPAIERALAAPGGGGPPGPDTPLTLGATLVLTGQRLRAESLDPARVTRVRLGDAELVPEEGAEADTLLVPLASPSQPPDALATLRAGLCGAQVVHRDARGAVVAESGVEPLRLRPTITATAQGEGEGRSLEIQVSPPLAPRQRAFVMLNQAEGGLAYSLPVPPPQEPARLLVPAGRARPGAYLVRLQVDGVDSPLQADPQRGFLGPQVVLL